MTVVTVSHEELTLSALIWARTAGQPIGYLEKVLDLNPGIATDVYLEVGAEITLPDIESDTEQTSSDLVRLWD